MLCHDGLLDNCRVCFCCIKVPIEEELATDFSSVKAGASGGEAEDAGWQPLYRALLNLAQVAIQQPAEQCADTTMGSLLEAPDNSSTAAEDCCSFAHSLIGRCCLDCLAQLAAGHCC